MIHLRAIEPEDLDLLYTIENDRDLWDIGTTNVPYSRYVLHDYIAQSSGDIYTDRQVRLIIEHCGDHDNARPTTVGIVDLVNFDPRNRRAEVSIVVQKPFRRKGYAREALAQLADYAHTVLHLHQLYAIVDTENTISASLFKTSGYTANIPLKDWLYDGENYHDATLYLKKIEKR